VFAPNSQHRAIITPAKRGKGSKAKVSDSDEAAVPAERHAAMTWAQRLKRVFNIDIETCSACGGAVKVHTQSTRCARGAGSRVHRGPRRDPENPDSPEGKGRMPGGDSVIRESGSADWPVHLIPKPDHLIQDAVPSAAAGFRLARGSE